MALGKHKELNEALNIMAKFNQMPEIKLDLQHLSSADLKLQSPTNSRIFSIILRPYPNFFKLLALIILYNAISLNYIGVTVGITSLLQINPYFIYSLSAVFEFVGIILCFMNDRIGRKKALLIHLFITSVSSLVVAFLPDEAEFSWFLVFKVLFFLIARTMVSAAFNTFIVYSAELYEVRVRSTAVVILGSLGYFSSLISPQINQLKTLIWQPLPYLIYATTGFVSCFLLTFLPQF